MKRTRILKRFLGCLMVLGLLFQGFAPARADQVIVRSSHPDSMSSSLFWIGEDAGNNPVYCLNRKAATPNADTEIEAVNEGVRLALYLGYPIDAEGVMRDYSGRNAKTGDESQAGMWGAVLGASLLALIIVIVLLVTSRKRKKD